MLIIVSGASVKCQFPCSIEKRTCQFSFSLCVCSKLRFFIYTIKTHIYITRGHNRAHKCFFKQSFIALFSCNIFCIVLKVLQIDRRTEKLSDQLHLFTPIYMHTCVYNTLLCVLYVTMYKLRLIQCTDILF